MHLPKAEEQLMEFIWTQKKVFMKDLIDLYPEPKPASTTLATLLKRMQEKGFVGYTLYGNSREYHPLISKEDYFSNQVNGLIKTHFENSALQFASFFTTATGLSTEELESLRKLIEKKLDNHSEK
jgi:BlaI family penicillinase repressor